MIATGGNTAVGGDDSDSAIVDFLVAAHPKLTFSLMMDRRSLLVVARRARERLSDTDSVVIRATLHDGGVLEVPLSRKQFDTLATPLLQRTLNCALCLV